MVAGARENFMSNMAHDGLDLIEGEALFTGPHSVEITLNGGGKRQISAPVIVIDTGTRPVPLDAAQNVRVLDSTSIVELDELPEHLIIVGEGYIGLEFGQMFRRFGSEVTIIQSRPRLLMNEDDDVADEVAAVLREEGINILTAADAVQAEETGGGRLQLTVRTPDGEQRIVGSHLLAAIGRIPNTDALAPLKPESSKSGTATFKSTSTWRPLPLACTPWAMSPARLVHPLVFRRLPHPARQPR